MLPSLRVPFLLSVNNYTIEMNIFIYCWEREFFAPVDGNRYIHTIRAHETAPIEFNLFVLANDWQSHIQRTARIS